MVLTTTAILAFVLAGCSVLFFQRSLIYHPRQYKQEKLAEAASLGIVTIEATTSEGRQFAYYWPPLAPGGSGERPPEVLMVLCGGNGSLALDWIGWIERLPEDLRAKTGFLMMEYPSYAANAGAASPSTLRDATVAEYEVFAERLGKKPEELRPRMILVGHSLGAAAALEFAQKYPPRVAYLLAPFTSMLDMARLVVGRPFAWLLRHRFDNRARLAELAELPEAERPHLVILHGTADDVIPASQSQELHALAPGWSEFHLQEHGDHMTPVDVVFEEFLGPAIRKLLDDLNDK